MIRKDIIKTSLLKRHHKRNPKVCLVPEATILALITKAPLFIVGTITTLVRAIQVVTALTKIIIVLIIKGPHILESYKCGFLKGHCPRDKTLITLT